MSILHVIKVAAINLSPVHTLYSITPTSQVTSQHITNNILSTCTLAHCYEYHSIGLWTYANQRPSEVFCCTTLHFFKTYSENRHLATVKLSLLLSFTTGDQHASSSTW